MDCAAPKHNNQSSLRECIDIPSQPVQSDLTHKSLKTAQSRNSAARVQRNPNIGCDSDRPPRRQGNIVNNKSRPVESRSRNALHRDAPTTCPPVKPACTRPQNNKPGQSKLEQHGSTPSALRPVAVAPCLTNIPNNPSDRDLLNAQLKEQILLPLLQQKQCTAPARLVDQPTTMPIPSNQNAHPAPVPIAPRPREITTRQDDTSLASTPTQKSIACKPPPVIPEVLSRPPTHPSTLNDLSGKPSVSLPPPPGLSKPGNRPNGTNNTRNNRPPTQPPRVPIQAVKDPNFERHNGPVASSPVISPPPGLSVGSVKIPVRKDVRPIPRSPSTTASSSASEDLSGSSLVLSDTTFTSVESSMSNKPPFRSRKDQICKNWSNGFDCFRTPCPYRHGAGPENDVKPAMRPAQQPQQRPFPKSSSNIANPISNHSAEPGSDVKTAMRPAQQPQQRPFPKSSSNIVNPISNHAPEKHDGSTNDAESSQRPELLYSTTISDHIKVKFDQGFDVQEVVTGFESRWVHLGNLPSYVNCAELNKLLAPYAVDNINLPELPPKTSKKPITAKVQFVSPADAMRAVTDLNGIDLGRSTITAKLAMNNSIRGNTTIADTDVQVAWDCPSRVGYAGYATLKEAKDVMNSVNGFLMDYLVVSADLYEGLPAVGAYSVIFKRLPAHVTEADLRKLGNAESIMLDRPNYQSLDSAVKSIRSKLESYGTVTSFDVLPAPFKDGLVKAWARFTSPAEARAAQDDFDRRRPGSIGHTSISCRHVVSMSHPLKNSFYQKMRDDIGWLRYSWYRRYGHSVSIRERFGAHEDAPVYIRLSSERPELLSALKYEFEQLIHGETITLEKKLVWDDFFVANAGRAFIDQLHRQYPGIQIQVQTKRRVLSLWGPIVKRHRARQDIVRKVMELKALQFWRVPLSGKLVGIFCSAELSTLQESLGPENCMMDFGEHCLIVRGNESAFRTACQAVQSAQNRHGDETRTSGSICPVCFGEPVVPMSLKCGHEWCRTCLTGYLASAVDNKAFPLRCLGNDATCTHCIPLGLSRRLLPAADFNAIIEAAFWQYVHLRSEEFHHCPTPNCTQVYRSAPPNAVLQCPSCLVRICPACRIEYHDGLTCEERDAAEDKLFDEWTTNHDVKSCPGCKAPIERSEGCNHMTCTRCQTHICWECLATFPRGEGIYEHMRETHGGIGL